MDGRGHGRHVQAPGREALEVKKDEERTVKKDPRQNQDRLISGKLRPKAARRGAKSTTVTVDGSVLTWALRHSWYVRGTGADRRRAWSISVSLQPERTRELILEFALSTEIAESSKADAAVLREIENGVRLAQEAGWDPESRGRAFRFAVGGLEGPDERAER